VTFEAVHVQGAETVAREAVGLPASCLCLASAPIQIQGLLTSVLEDAANWWSRRRFRALRSFARAPCLARVTHCSARSPSSSDCCQYCR
jgi:hypothetical protein